jgi:hypothetical protein
MCSSISHLFQPTEEADMIKAEEDRIRATFDVMTHK